jgi:hypothetical protein
MAMVGQSLGARKSRHAGGDDSNPHHQNFLKR